MTAAQGLESVSVRHVAAEAAVSPGMVQHYFRTGLLALVDGLAMHALMLSNTAEQSLAVFDHHLKGLFSGSG